MKKQIFRVKLIKDDKTSGVGFAVLSNADETFGKRSQVKVMGTVDGYPYRGSIAPYGGIHYIAVKKEIRV